MQNLKNKKIKLCKGILQYAPTGIIFCQIFAIFFLLSTPMVFAEEKAKTIADIPNICWTKAQCEERIKEDKGIFNEESFKEDTVIETPSDKGCSSYKSLVGNLSLGQCYMTPKGSTLQIAIPGQIEKDSATPTNIAQYIKAIYQFTVAIAALLAVVMIMIAGVRWMTAMGNQGQLDSAKTMMMNSIIGLVLALGSYFILHSINPALVQNKMPQVAMIRTEVLKMQEFIPLNFCNKPTGLKAYCISPILNQDNCTTAKCFDLNFVCQVRSIESLSGNDEITKKMKKNPYFLYNSVFNKYYLCYDKIFVPLKKDQECKGGKNKINGVDHCQYYIDMSESCGKFKTGGFFSMEDIIGGKCSENRKCVIFPEDGWETRLDGPYLKKAECVY